MYNSKYGKYFSTFKLPDVVKTSFLAFSDHFSPHNMITIRDEHVEQFHPKKFATKSSYRSELNAAMLADYC